MTRTRNISLLSLLFALIACVICACLLVGCGGGGGATSEGTAEDTAGDPFTPPSNIALSVFNASAATGQNNAFIDISQASLGYVGASATSGSRLKLQVTKNGQSMNYDMPSDGTPIIAPLDMGNGTYTISVMQNTSGSRYAELYSTSVNAKLQTEQAPYLVPNVFCDYDENSQVVWKARELTQNAENEGDALRLIYEWIENNVSYDNAKAEQLAGKSGYIPDPDETLQTQRGICFDYASLAAAMLRSLGIPCQIVTGYVSPDGVYHAWNMVWIDGSWKAAHFTVNPKDWTRVDLTFAANGAGSTVGDGSNYTDRYVY
ncbi:transglutaminase-like domain-containing protein [Anaerotardibacter muris]|uniref:transglutaminase-like domain-containing protein n=1 Tax=Anaerotardibacter muris TaxID=2941505 RepID=UPI00203C0879|nr:transglutaminase-like domain-containing protein [Anaerotardibacter muris]